jgi:hypothetical protein
LKNPRLCLSFEQLEDRIDPATLYVLTHGLQPGMVTLPLWLPDMAEAINRRENLGYTASQIAQSVVPFTASSAAPGGAADFLIFDWVDNSGYLRPGTADDLSVAGKLAQFVRDRFPATGTLDVHFIGHSRGAYVVFAAVEYLNNPADNAHIGRLQMTTLDPEYYSSPFNAENRPLIVPSNVDFADNYYQRVDRTISIPGVTSSADPWFGGQTVAGALNVDLSDALRTWPGRGGIYSLTPSHEEVRDWYHWTIEAEDAAAGAGHQANDLNQQQAGFLLGDASRSRATLFGQTLDLNLDGLPDDLGHGSRSGFDYSVRPAGGPTVVIGTDIGGEVRVYYPHDPARVETLKPFDGFQGAVRVASADFNGDGVGDVVVGTGPGVATRVLVLDGVSHAVLFDFQPFETSFIGGVYVATGDVTGDGIPELVITPDEGGGPRIRVFDGVAFAQVDDFFGIDDANFRGGARAAVGDLSGDGFGDLIVAAGFGGGPRIAAFDGRSLGQSYREKVFGDFFAYEPTLRNGVFVAAGDFNGDNVADLVLGAGPDGGPRVRILNGAGLSAGTQQELANLFLGNPDGRGGIRVAAKDLDEDGRADLIGGSGFGTRGAISGFSAINLGREGERSPLEFTPFPDYTGGVFVG